MLWLFSAIVLLHRTATVDANAWLGTICPDDKNTYYANMPGWELDYYEFPIDVKYDSANQAVDPCTYLLSLANAKYRDINLLSAGQFGTTVCQRSCERAVKIVTPQCGPRRMPLQWATQKFDASLYVTKINCSNWNLPYNDTEILDPIHLHYAPTTANETDDTYSYLESIVINKITFTLAPITKKPNVNYINAMLLKYQEIGQQLNYIHLLGGTGSLSKLVGLEATLMQMPDVRGLVLQYFDIKALGPFLSDMTKLLYVDLSYLPITSFPSWLTSTPNLMYLKIEGPSPSLTQISNLDMLPNLEYFMMRVTNVSVLPDIILPQSVNLRYLDLSCNQLSSFPDHFFDHFTQLQGLMLGGNPVTTLAVQTLYSLPNLKVIDLKQPDPASLNDYYSSSSDTVPQTTLSEMDNSNVKLCSTNAPYPGFVDLTNAHFIKNQLLQRVELSGNVDLKIPDDLLFGLEDTLQTLDLYGLKLTNLDGLNIERLCELRKLRVANNNFGIDLDWLPFVISINLQKLKNFYVANANISFASPSLYVLSRTDETMQAFIIADVSTQPISEKTCEESLWDSLLRNNPYDIPDDDNGTCYDQFIALKAEAKIWQDQRKNLSIAPCFATLDSDAHQYGPMIWLTIAALIFLTKF